MASEPMTDARLAEIESLDASEVMSWDVSLAIIRDLATEVKRLREIRDDLVELMAAAALLLDACACLPDRDAKLPKNGHRWRLWTEEADKASDRLNKAIQAMPEGA